jgi:hypothetical protein
MLGSISAATPSDGLSLRGIAAGLQPSGIERNHINHFMTGDLASADASRIRSFLELTNIVQYISKESTIQIL